MTPIEVLNAMDKVSLIGRFGITRHTKYEVLLQKTNPKWEHIDIDKRNNEYTIIIIIDFDGYNSCQMYSICMTEAIDCIRSSDA